MADSPATVLVAEDDPVVLDLLLAVLREELGVRAFGVRDGRQALRLVEDGGVDLVLVDAAMAGLDGSELAAQMRARPETRAIPIVATGAAPGGAAPVAPWSAAFVPKPFELDDLLEVVRRNLPRG
ncbi:MAG TPA: response regulator [Chloroflexota bacterium]